MRSWFNALHDILYIYIVIIFFAGMYVYLYCSFDIIHCVVYTISQANKCYVHKQTRMNMALDLGMRG